MNRRASCVGTFEVFEAAHVASNNSQPVNASQFVSDLYCRMPIWPNKSTIFCKRMIQITNCGRWLEIES